MKNISDSILLSIEEYEELKNPEKCYTFMTKSSAKKLVKKLLKDNNKVCWNDTDESYDDGCCSYCCVYKILGDDAAERICERPKRWSK